MGLFKRLFGKEEAKTTKKYVFSDEDREASNELRQKKREIELMKLERESELHRLKIEKQKLELQQELDELRGVYEDVEEASEDNDMMKMITAFAPLLMKNINQNTVSAPSTPATNSVQNPLTPQEVQKQSISDSELEKIWANTPFIAKQYAKKMDDEHIIMYLKQQMPNIDEDTYARALKIIRK